MRSRICLLGCFLATQALWLSPTAYAQSDVRVAVAGLRQDLNLLSQEVRTLRLEIEQLSRENTALRAQLQASLADPAVQVKLANFSAALERLQQDYRAADADNKTTIIAELNRKMATLTQQVQVAIDTVGGAQPKISTPVHFSEDYPKTGVTYTVRSGDTLSAIARAHGSTVKHIQNANKIVNPSRDLQVGQTIFIPVTP
ncbi:MAG: LysM peptidoglycan-binding domain-containing protein [Opitutales bacterium]|jgi:LysM repeat protein